VVRFEAWYDRDETSLMVAKASILRRGPLSSALKGWEVLGPKEVVW
jgi:hypothetical protein